MIKKYVLLGGLAFIVIVLAVFGYVSLKQAPVVASPYSAMPASTMAVLTINNYSRTVENLLLNNLMWQELSMDEDVKQFGKNLILLDSLIKNDSWSEEIVEDISWHIGFHTSGQGFDRSIIIPLKNEKNTDFLSWFESFTSSKSLYGIYEGVEISQLNFKDSLFDPLFFCIYKGLFVSSSKPNLVEDAIRTLIGENSLYHDKDFKKVESTSGTFADWNFFLNYQDLASMKMLGIDAAEFSKGDIIWSDWTALDATVHPDLFLLNGFSNAKSNSFLSVFEKQKAQDVDAIEIIPNNASLFFHFGVSNYKLYAKSKREYFKSVSKEKAYNDKIEKLKQEYHFDIESEFDQWVSNEFGMMYLPDETIKAEDSKIAFFRLSDIRRTTSALENLSRMTDETESDLSRIKIEGFLNDFESVIFEDLDNPYFIILDKYLLLSSHKDLLQYVKKQYLQANTLKKSELYSRFSGNLSDRSNVYLYIHLEKGKEVYDDILNENSLAFFKDNPTFAKKFEQIGIQFQDGKKGLYYQHMALNFNPKQRSQGNVLWEAILDTDLVMKPAIVYNHYSNAREILVQDVSNKIYLIDNKGNVIWKRQMKERISSKVYQIDVYKNNKLQMLFSGESSIYLLDRKGRDVENFPVQLPALSTNELKVIDYEKNREYRILIGIRGGEILNFDRFGKKIKGWSFKASDEITYPINYFFLNGSDYIVTAGEEGHPYILNRRGEVRLKIDESLPPYSGKDYKLELSNDINQCKFITTDEAGNFIKLQFNGEKEIVNLDMVSDQHQFLFDDINNDRKNDYILLDSNKLMVFDHNREKLYEIELEGNDPAFLNTYRFDAGYGKVGFTDVLSKQVYLYRDAGGLDNNFPLKGNTAFSITDLNKDGLQNLIVGLNKRLVVYNLR